MSIKHLRERQARLDTEERGLRIEARDALAKARADGGQLTDAQRARDDEIKKRLASIETEREQLADELRNAERLADLERSTPAASRIQVTDSAEAAAEDPMRGFKTPREYIQAVQLATVTGGREMDPRLRPLAAAGSDEHSTFSDPHGGFAVPAAMAPEILSVPAEVDPTLGRVRGIPMTAPSVSFLARVDKNHNSSVSGGLTVSRRDESGTAASSRQSYEKVTLKANSQFGIAYATEEILTDSPISFAALIADGFGEEFASETLNERLNGTGVGEYLGVLNAGCTISVAKESGQSADTIVGLNVMKMRARAWRYGNCIWLANHDTQVELMQSHVALTNDDVKLFAPGNGVDRPDTLFGRPIFFTEYCSTLGDKGDLILADFSQYLEGTYEGLQSAESMHVRFLEHERTFKFYRRNDGQPWWRSALTPKKGASTLSPFVTLAARA